MTHLQRISLTDDPSIMSSYYNDLVGGYLLCFRTGYACSGSISFSRRVRSI